MKKSKNVGILTFHYSNNNFGALLQTYAVLNVIKLFCPKAKIINFKPEKPKGVKQFFFSLIRYVLGYNFTKFRKHYIDFIPVESRIENLNNKLDTFIVGSDQVWRYRDNHDNLLKYFFNFVNDENKKISYAASFGLDKWHGNPPITDDVKNLIKRFESISVRELSGVNICKETFDVNSTLVLDSTLLLDKSHYEKIIQSRYSVNHKKNIYLSYMLLDDTNFNQSFFKSFAKEHNLIFKKLKGLKVSNKYDFWKFNSVAKWLYLINNSEIIVTDSFHCTVFSIIFKKKFVVLSNPHRGITRIENLLDLIGRKDRLFNNIKEIDDNVLINDFDYNKIGAIIDVERQKSLSFLKDSLMN